MIRIIQKVTIFACLLLLGNGCAYDYYLGRAYWNEASVSLFERENEKKYGLIIKKGSKVIDIIETPFNTKRDYVYSVKYPLIFAGKYGESNKPPCLYVFVNSKWIAIDGSFPQYSENIPKCVFMDTKHVYHIVYHSGVDDSIFLDDYVIDFNNNKLQYKQNVMALSDNELVWPNSRYCYYVMPIQTGAIAIKVKNNKEGLVFEIRQCDGDKWSDVRNIKTGLRVAELKDWNWCIADNLKEVSVIINDKNGMLVNNYGNGCDSQKFEPKFNFHFDDNNSYWKCGCEYIMHGDVWYDDWYHTLLSVGNNKKYVIIKGGAIKIVGDKDIYKKYLSKDRFSSGIFTEYAKKTVIPESF